MSVRIDHVGIATNDISEALPFWKLIGFTPTEVELNEEQGVRIQMLQGKDSEGEPTHSKVELLEPISVESPISRFISSRGEGMQQLAVTVNDIHAIISELKKNGFQMINDTPTIGSGGSLIAFVHPKSTGGVLVELVERNVSEAS